MSLLSVRNSIDDAIHEQYDKKVVKAVGREPTPTSLLTSIVAYAGTALNQKYSSMVAVDELLAQYPALEGVLLDAWSKKSFKDIRNLLILQVPKTPTKTDFGLDALVRSPEATSKETDDAVQRKLDSYRPQVQNFLRRSEPWDFWEPPADDPRVAKHCADLRIPFVSRIPQLLLHDLGGSVVDPEIVSEVFADTNAQLVNTSGSGKTRILLEGLSKHWGFYISCTKRVDTFGSRDMSNILDYIPRSRGFTEHLHQESEHFLKSLRHNRMTARRRFLQLLAARHFWLRFFLQEARKLTPHGSLDRYRLHWLYFQLRPENVTDVDVFDYVTYALNSASDEYLGLDSSGIIPEIKNDINNNYLSTRLYIIVDEAQKPAQLLREAFRSDNDTTQRRSVLRELLSTWEPWGHLIVSGTDLSIAAVAEATGSEVAKRGVEYHLRTRTGSFDTRSGQANYIRRYLPPHILESESGQYLLHRVWSWLRGRHRFTAAFLDLLVEDSFRSPHRLLDRYINHFTQMTPSDSPPFTDKEPHLTTRSTNSVLATRFVDFSRVIEDREIAHRFGDIIYEWVLHQRYVGHEEPGQEWVEFGFARFIENGETSSNKTIVDEPVVILAAINQLSRNSPFGLGNRVVESMKLEDNNGAKFEDLLALYLSHAFGPDVKLCDVFDFGQNVPEWAQMNGVEFVVPSNDGQYHKVDFSSGSTFSSVLGLKSKDADETVKWFKIPFRGICFPDRYFGPDIAMFLRLPDGRIICLIVQAKWRSMVTLSKRDGKDAVSTLEPSEFYQHKNLTDAQWRLRRRDILDSVRKLGVIEDEKWFPDGMPFLRALGCFPANYRERSGPVAHLNMARCLEFMDNGTILANIARAVVEKREYKRTYGDFDDPDLPGDRGTAEKKRRRD